MGVGGGARRYGNPLINEGLASPRHRLSRLSPVVVCVFTATGPGAGRTAVQAVVPPPDSSSGLQGAWGGRQDARQRQRKSKLNSRRPCGGKSSGGGEEEGLGGKGEGGGKKGKGAPEAGG